MRNEFDWPAIRAGYERGISPVELARSIPESPSRQAIEKRAKKEGWEVAQRADESLPATERDIVLQYIRNGATNKLAAAAAGISGSTLTRWLQDDEFSALVQAARAAHLTKHIGNIDSAGERDWKASAYILERATETKDQFSQHKDSGGLTIVLNIDRRTEEERGITIEHDPPGTVDSG